MHKVIGACPVCGQELEVTRLRCPNCETTIEGSFGLGPLRLLNPEQLEFVELFLKARGSLKELGEVLHISYPTVVNRLNDILIALGYRDSVRPAEDAAALAGQRRELLERLARGEITADDAARQLKGR